MVHDRIALELLNVISDNYFDRLSMEEENFYVIEYKFYLRKIHLSMS